MWTLAFVLGGYESYHRETVSTLLKVKSNVEAHQEVRIERVQRHFTAAYSLLSICMWPFMLQGHLRKNEEDSEDGGRSCQAVVVKEGWRGNNFNKDVGLTDNKSATALLLAVKQKKIVARFRFLPSPNSPCSQKK